MADAEEEGGGFRGFQIWHRVSHAPTSMLTGGGSRSSGHALQRDTLLTSCLQQLPLAPGQAQAMATMGGLTLKRTWKERRDTGQHKGSASAQAHCNSMALQLLLEGKHAVPLGPWHQPPHPRQEEAKAHGGSLLMGSPFFLCSCTGRVQTSNRETHTG